MSTPATVYLSKKGMKELKRTVAKLEREVQQAQVDLREMSTGTSREERFERTEKLSRVEALESELYEKRLQLQNAKLLPRKREALKVALGSVVDLLDTNGRMVRYTLVDSMEANPSDGRISIQSPLGKSLIGRSKEEVVQWNAGIKSNQFQLVRIS
ncbi:MAG: GreA/GreB family elongation factor [Candidatus Saccharimonadales bacterium]